MTWLKVIAFCLLSPLLLVGVLCNLLISSDEFHRAIERLMK